MFIHIDKIIRALRDRIQDLEEIHNRLDVFTEWKRRKAFIRKKELESFLRYLLQEKEKMKYIETKRKQF